MNILVTGASGFLGRHTVVKLVEHGFKVKALVRSAATPNFSCDVEVIVADLRSVTKYESALKDVNAIVHLAAAVSGTEDEQFNTSVVATEALLGAAARSGVRRFIHVSSLVVYDSNLVNRELTEESSLVADPVGLAPYSVAKIWQERIVIEAARLHEWHLTVLRPGFVWGRGRGEIGGMGRTIGPVQVVFGPLSRLPLTYVENCADFIACVVPRVPTHVEVFNVIDGDEVRVWSYAREYLRRVGSRLIPFPVPYVAGMALAKIASVLSNVLFGPSGRLPGLLIPKRYQAQFKPLRYSNRKMSKDAKWSPPYTFEESLVRAFSRNEK